MHLVASLHAMPMLSNEDLKTRGVRIPEADLPFLPSHLAADTRVDAGVLRFFESLVKDRKLEVQQALSPPADIGVGKGLATADELLLRRFLASDAVLCELLASSAPVDYAGVLGQRKDDLLRLAQEHIVFYSRDARTLEPESALMRRVVEARLDSAAHNATIALARALLARQEALRAEAAAERYFDCWKGGEEEMTALKALSAAQKTVADWTGKIRKLRREIAPQAAKRAVK